MLRVDRPRSRARVVFNVHRDRLMAGTESARSCGKGKWTGYGRKRFGRRRHDTRTDPCTTQRSLGEGFCEQRVITEQMAQLSIDGNVLRLAGDKYKQVGSDVIAVKGDAPKEAPSGASTSPPGPTACTVDNDSVGA